MTISTSVPANLRRPGTFHEFINTQAGRGLVPLDVRIALIGIKLTSGTAAAGAPVQVFDETDAAAKFGAGSQLTLMCLKAFSQARLKGSMPQIWAVAIDPPAGVAATETLTVTATSAAAGNIVIQISGRTIVVGVSAGDTAATIATALKSAIDSRLAYLPITAGVVGGVLTATANHIGVWGNDIAYSVGSAPSGVSVALAAPVAGTGTVDITASLDVLVDKDYDAICIGNHGATDVSDLVAHNTVQWGYGAKLYRHGFIGERGTLSTANALAVAANDKTVVIVGCEGCPNLPGEIAVAAAVAAYGKTRPNANLDGEVLDLFPPAPADAFAASEIESALASGMTPLTPTPEGTAVRIERLVTTKTTESGAPFDALRDIAMSRTDAFMARQTDIGYRLGFHQEVLDSGGELLARVRDMVIRIHKAAEAAGILRDVDAFKDQIIVAEADSPVGRILVQDPYRVAGPLHQAAFIHINYL